MRAELEHMMEIVSDWLAKVWPEHNGLIAVLTADLMVGRNGLFEVVTL